MITPAALRLELRYDLDHCSELMVDIKDLSLLSTKFQSDLNQFLSVTPMIEALTDKDSFELFNWIQKIQQAESRWIQKRNALQTSIQKVKDCVEHLSDDGFSDYLGQSNGHPSPTASSPPPAPLKNCVTVNDVDPIQAECELLADNVETGEQSVMAIDANA